MHRVIITFSAERSRVPTFIKFVVAVLITGKLSIIGMSAK